MYMNGYEEGRWNEIMIYRKKRVRIFATENHTNRRQEYRDVALVMGPWIQVRFPHTL